jgi:hypothetical protein
MQLIDTYRTMHLEHGHTSGAVVPSVVVVRSSWFAPEQLQAIPALNLQRLAHESCLAFLARVEAHVLATRPASELPAIVAGEYDYCD